MTHKKKPAYIFFYSALISLSFLFILISSSCSKDLNLPPKINSTKNNHSPQNYYGKNGMVVAAHPLAAKAGLEMLKDQKGNAIDAAIATAFALNVVEPFASGIGGGGFMVIYSASNHTVTTINFREKAPSGAFPGMYNENGKLNKKLRREHGLAVAVPGALAGWDYALKKYGTKSLGDVIKKALEYSENGFPVSKTYSLINKDEYEKLLLLDGENSCYLNKGFPFEPGEILKNPALANLFKKIAARGIDEFYTGETAQKIVKTVRSTGGILTMGDLAEYSVKESAPLVGTYKDYTIHTISPPGSGGLHVIQLLNMLECLPVKKWGHNSASYIHHFSEALRFLFSDRTRYLGDPDFISIPITDLISKKYARSIINQIEPNKKNDFYPPGKFEAPHDEAENTTHLCVIDKMGNIVSLTQSINHFFGSGIVPEKSGFLLNNHMDDFSQLSDSVNAPNKNRRPVSSMGPLIIFKGDHPYLVLGTPGGIRIFSSLTQIILNSIEFGMSLDEAIEAPRFFSSSSNGKADPIRYESRISEEVIRLLHQYGHALEKKGDYDNYFGGAQGLLFLHKKNLIIGGADSRRDGFGAGY